MIAIVGATTLKDVLAYQKSTRAVLVMATFGVMDAPMSVVQ